MAVAQVELAHGRGALRVRGLATVVGVALVAVVAGLVIAGYRPLVVRSGSMEPGIRTGDLIVTRLSAPAEAEVGDIVTFQDPTRGGDLVTHRVIRRTPTEQGFRFVTRGDANTGVERWSIPREGTLGIHDATVPRAGYVMSWLGSPPARLLALGLGGLLLALTLLRRIWGR